MASYLRQCDWCHEEFVAHNRVARFCSNKCRQAHYRHVHGRPFRGYVLREGGPVEAEGRPVEEYEIAQAVVGVRSAIGVFSAAELTGPTDLRPVCSRLKASLLTALEVEGL